MTQKRKTKIIKSSVCGREFETSYSGGAIRCSECSKNKAAALERPYTRDTVFLVCKWFGEGMTVKRSLSFLTAARIISVRLWSGAACMM